MWKLIEILPEALQKGKQLADPNAWIVGGSAAGVLVVLINMALAILDLSGHHVDIGPTDIHTVANGITIVGSLIVGYSNVATNPNIGLPALK